MTSEEQVEFKRLECERDEARKELAVARKDAATIEVELYRERTRRWTAEAEAGGLRRDVEVLQRERREFVS